MSIIKIGNRSGKLLAKNDFYIRMLIYDPDYRIQEDGRIMTLIQATGKRSVSGNWRELVQYQKDGRLQISYRKKKLLMHRVIYQKFIGELEEDLTINHKDGNPLNNSVSNLELHPHFHNNEHRFRVLKKPAVIGHKKISKEIAEAIREDKRKGATHRKLQEKYNLSKSSISYIVNRRTWS